MGLEKDSSVSGAPTLTELRERVGAVTAKLDALRGHL